MSILQIGPVALPVYPLALVLAFWAALAVAARVAQPLGVDGDHLWNAGLYGLVAMALAGRLAHVIAFWPAYRLQPLDIVGFNTQAFLWTPGAVAGLAVAAGYIYRHKLPWATTLDAVAVGGVTGVMIAELGAFVSGINIGAPSAVPWAVDAWGVARHPVQVYAVLGLAVTLATVLRAQRKPYPPGILAWAALLGWGITTWLIEPFRADSAILLGGFRATQIVGLLSAAAALWAFRRRAIQSF